MNKMMGGKKAPGMKKPMMGKKAMAKGPKAVPAIGMSSGGMATKKAK